MQWLSNNEGSNITISEDDSNNLDIVVSSGNVRVGADLSGVTSDTALTIGDSGDCHLIMGEDSNNTGRLTWDASENAWEFSVIDAGTTRANALVIDSAGIVAVGVTPVAVNTSHKSLQLGGNTNIQSYGTTGASGEVDFCHNVYYATDTNFKLISEDEATLYRQGSGKHEFYSWPSAAAGSTVNVNAAARKLTIDSAGLATFSNGIVTSEKGILSGSVTVDHHGVTTITPQRKGGFLMLSSDITAGDGNYPQPADSSQIWFDCGSSLDIQKQTTDASTNIGVDVEVSTSDVTGTTGTSGKITVAVQTDVIKIENRSGGARTFNYTIIS